MTEPFDGTDPDECSPSLTHPEIRAWLSAFAACVRSNDPIGGRALFAADVVGFGTRAEAVFCLDDLVSRQWGRIWPFTRGFDFRQRPLIVHLSEDGRQACVMALWDSWATRKGEEIHRPGRATLLLVRERLDGSWVGKHTHFSRTPPDDPEWGDAEVR